MQAPPSAGAVPRDLVNEELPAHYVVDVLERRSTALWLRCKLMAPEVLRPHGLIARHFLQVMLVWRSATTSVGKAEPLTLDEPWEVNWKYKSFTILKWCQQARRMHARTLCKALDLIQGEWVASFAPLAHPRPFQDPGGAYYATALAPLDVWNIIMDQLDSHVLVRGVRGVCRQLRQCVDRILTARVSERRNGLAALRQKLRDLLPAESRAPMHRGLHDLVMASPVVWEAEAAEGALPLLWPHRRLLAVSRGKDMLPLRSVLLSVVLAHQVQMMKRLQPPNPRNQTYLFEIMSVACLIDDTELFKWVFRRNNNSGMFYRHLESYALLGDSYRVALLPELCRHNVPRFHYTSNDLNLQPVLFLLCRSSADFRHIRAEMLPSLVATLLYDPHAHSAVVAQAAVKAVSQPIWPIEWRARVWDALTRNAVLSSVAAKAPVPDDVKEELRRLRATQTPAKPPPIPRKFSLALPPEATDAACLAMSPAAKSVPVAPGALSKAFAAAARRAINAPFRDLLSALDAP